uniref:Capsid protein n=1 Tax=Giant panda feces-associated circular DNA virus TaxID=2863989 RepID=A0A8K1HIS1_9VIRU|nr:capsid protein [Giant panda feces-associated circular DNA virus]
MQDALRRIVVDGAAVRAEENGIRAALPLGDKPGNGHPTCSANRAAKHTNALNSRSLVKGVQLPGHAIGNKAETNAGPNGTRELITAATKLLDLRKIDTHLVTDEVRGASFSLVVAVSHSLGPGLGRSYHVSNFDGSRNSFLCRARRQSECHTDNTDLGEGLHVIPESVDERNAGHIDRIVTVTLGRPDIELDDLRGSPSDDAAPTRTLAIAALKPPTERITTAITPTAITTPSTVGHGGNKIRRLACVELAAMLTEVLVALAGRPANSRDRQLLAKREPISVHLFRKRGQFCIRYAGANQK